MWAHVHLISTLIGINWFKSRLCFSKWLQPVKTRKELSLKYKGLPKSPPGPWFSTSPSPKPGARPPQLHSVQGTQWDEGREPHVPSFPPSTSPICGFLNSAKLGNKQTLKTQHCETQQCCNTFRTWSWPPNWTNVKRRQLLHWYLWKRLTAQRTVPQVSQHEQASTSTKFICIWTRALFRSFSNSMFTLQKIQPDQILWTTTWENWVQRKQIPIKFCMNSHSESPAPRSSHCTTQINIRPYHKSCYISRLLLKLQISDLLETGVFFQI